MDDKLVYFLLIIIGLCGGAYWLMGKTRKGKIVFLITFTCLLLINLCHLNWVKNLPKTSKWGANLGAAVGYAIATLFEAILLVIFATIWFFARRRKAAKVGP